MLRKNTDGPQSSRCGPFLFHLTFLLLGASGLVLVQLLGTKTQNSIAQRNLLIPPKGIENFSFGYNEMAADSVWLRVIPDLDYCENRAQAPKKKANTPVKGPRVETARDPVEFLIDRKHAPSLCHMGWVYQMLDRTTDLAPRFQLAYIVGGTSLSVLVGDSAGASAIFEKGLKEYPHDWSLAYRASYHYLYDLGDAQRAAELLTDAANNGGPPWMYSLAASLYSHLGQMRFARAFLIRVLKTQPRGIGADRIKKRLAEIDREIKQLDQK